MKLSELFRMISRPPRKFVLVTCSVLGAINVGLAYVGWKLGNQDVVRLAVTSFAASGLGIAIRLLQDDLEPPQP